MQGMLFTHASWWYAGGLWTKYALIEWACVARSCLRIGGNTFDKQFEVGHIQLR